jgi:hypothetical protein
MPRVQRTGSSAKCLGTPLAQQRLHRLENGLARIELKRPLTDGTLPVDMDPLSRLCRPAAAFSRTDVSHPRTSACSPVHVSCARSSRERALARAHRALARGRPYGAAAPKPLTRPSSGSAGRGTICVSRSSTKCAMRAVSRFKTSAECATESCHDVRSAEHRRHR